MRQKAVSPSSLRKVPETCGGYFPDQGAEEQFCEGIKGCEEAFPLLDTCYSDEAFQ